jgi:N-acyl amino acid synthase of PEP-CTERM/exosortase system
MLTQFRPNPTAMTDFNSRAERALSALYDRHFEVVAADTPELLDAAHALRYQVYCVEHALEDPAKNPGEREWDRYDTHSIHAVLISKRLGEVVGCMRLILPAEGPDPAALPIRSLLSEGDRATLDVFDRARTAEISRYAISKQYRRRQGESLYPDVEWHGPLADEMRRLVPHMSLGLIRGVYLMAAQHGIDTLCAAMAPPLLRLLERFGLVFERLGPVIDYHGMRQPCVAESRHLLAGLAARNPDYYQLVLQEGTAENAPARVFPWEHDT